MPLNLVDESLEYRVVRHLQRIKQSYEARAAAGFVGEVRSAWQLSIRPTCPNLCVDASSYPTVPPSVPPYSPLHKVPHVWDIAIAQVIADIDDNVILEGIDVSCRAAELALRLRKARRQRRVLLWPRSIPSKEICSRLMLYCFKKKLTGDGRQSVPLVTSLLDAEATANRAV